MVLWRVYSPCGVFFRIIDVHFVACCRTVSCVSLPKNPITPLRSLSNRISEDVCVLVLLLSTFVISACVLSPFGSARTAALYPDGKVNKHFDLPNHLSTALLTPAAFAAGALTVTVSLVLLAKARRKIPAPDEALRMARDTGRRVLRAIVFIFTLQCVSYLIISFDGTLVYVTPSEEAWFPLQVITTGISHVVSTLILTLRMRIPWVIRATLFVLGAVSYIGILLVNSLPSSMDTQIACGVSASFAVLLYFCFLTFATRGCHTPAPAALSPSAERALHLPFFARFTIALAGPFNGVFICVLASGATFGYGLISCLICIDIVRAISYVVALALAGHDETQIYQEELQILHRQQEEAVQHQRQQMLRYLIQHLRMPAENILGKLEECSTMMTELPQLRPRYDGIRTSVKSMCTVISDLNDMDAWLSGSMQLSMAFFRPLDIASTAVANCRPVIVQRAINVTIDMDAQLPLCFEADGDRLTQALTNLVHNACRHSPTSSSVHVRVLAVALPLKARASRQANVVVAKSVPTRDADNGSWVYKDEAEDPQGTLQKSSKSNTTPTIIESGIRFEVDDEGPGIPLDAQPKVFQPFEALDVSADVATGLSLAMSKRIIELHKGVIGFHSEPGDGTTFYFEVPIRQTSAPMPTVSESEQDFEVSPRTDTNYSTRSPFNPTRDHTMIHVN